MAEDTISGALCGVMAKALVESGVDPALAMVLAKKACEPTLRAVPGAAKATVRGAKKGARAVGKERRRQNAKLSRALKEANRRLRTKAGKLRKGKTQKDVMNLAQRLRKKM